jgi:hypothetical protein
LVGRRGSSHDRSKCVTELRRGSRSAFIAVGYGERASACSGIARETVRGRDAAPGAPMDGFTAFSRVMPECALALLPHTQRQAP